METQNKPSWTISDFRDITSQMKEGKLAEIRKYDIIKDILVCDEIEEVHWNAKEEVYFFREYGFKGRIFPLDEIISVGERCNLIVHGWKNKPFTLETQIYHDFHKGEELIVKVSRKRPGCNPSFKVFNYISGFIKDSNNGLYEGIDEGTKVLVKTICFKPTQKGYCVEVLPLEILK